MLTEKYEYELAIASRATAWSSTASNLFVRDSDSDRMVYCSCQWSKDLM